MVSKEPLTASVSGTTLLAAARHPLDGLRHVGRLSASSQSVPAGLNARGFGAQRAANLFSSYWSVSYDDPINYHDPADSSRRKAALEVELRIAGRFRPT